MSYSVMPGYLNHNLINKKSKGIDNILIALLKNNSWEIIPYLSKRINLSASNGKFPKCLKNSSVISIIKNRNETAIELFLKDYGKIVSIQIYSFMETTFLH